MVQIPDSLRQQLAPILKYHFWILGALVPLVLVPALFMASASRQAVIASERATIDGHVSALNAVKNETDHPNAAWTEAFDQQAGAVREELLKEWTAFWESQQPLRIWPDSLGPDFREAIGGLERGDRKELQFRDLQRYQNTVPDIVRELPARMGCEDQMATVDGEFGGAPGFGGRRPPGLRRRPGGEGLDDAEATQSRAVLEWSPEDQKRLLESFTWDKAPSTTQVLLAQEELWVYGLFCDAIRRMNEGATALFDSRITTVEQLAVGYPAAEDQPGGQGSGRVIFEGLSAAGGEMGEFAEGMPPAEPGMEMTEGMPGQLQPRPSHPRFSGGGGGFEGSQGPARGFGPPPGMGEGMEGIEAEGEGPSLSPDDLLKQWIYVDFTGRPLMASELATAPDAQLVHLMPFVLRVVIDQRQLDRFLAELASTTVPIDVRQVRINPSAQGMGEGGGRGGTRGGGRPRESGGGFGSTELGGAGGDRRRPFDVVVELRGTVGLATPPNPAAIGGAGDSEQPAGDEGGGV